MSDKDYCSLVDRNICIFPLWVQKIFRLEKYGLWVPWLGLSIVCFGFFSLLGFRQNASFNYYLAIGVATFGMFFCYSFSSIGLKIVLSLLPRYQDIVPSPQKKHITEEFEKCIATYCNLKCSIVWSIPAGVIITFALALPYWEQFRSIISKEFSIILFCLFFLSAFGTGFSFCCMAFSLKINTLISKFQPIKFYKFSELKYISNAFFKLSAITLVAYLNFIAFIFIMGRHQPYDIPLVCISLMVGVYVFSFFILTQSTIWRCAEKAKESFVNECINKAEIKNLHNNSLIMTEILSHVINIKRHSAAMPLGWFKPSALITGYIFPTILFLFSRFY